MELRHTVFYPWMQVQAYDPIHATDIRTRYSSLKSSLSVPSVGQPLVRLFLQSRDLKPAFLLKMLVILRFPLSVQP